MFWKQVLALLQKDALIEWRNRTSINGLLLYMSATIFVSYLALQTKNGLIVPATWNAIYWIILTSLSVNTSLKSFATEPQERNFTYFFLFSAQSIISAKIIYNAALVGFVSVLGLFIYFFVMGNPVVDVWLFIVVVVVGAMGMAVAMTLTAAISVQASQNQSLMPVLSMPVSIPTMLLSIKASQNAMEGMLYSQTYNYLMAIGAMAVISAVLSYILFPILWRE